MNVLVDVRHPPDPPVGFFTVILLLILQRFGQNALYYWLTFIPNDGGLASYLGKGERPVVRPRIKRPGKGRRCEAIKAFQTVPWNIAQIVFPSVMPTCNEHLHIIYLNIYYLFISFVQPFSSEMILRWCTILKTGNN